MLWTIVAILVIMGIISIPIIKKLIIKAKENKKDLERGEKIRRRFEGVDGYKIKLTNPQVKCGKEYEIPIYDFNGKNRQSPVSQMYEQINYYSKHIGWIDECKEMPNYCGGGFYRDVENQNTFYFTSISEYLFYRVYEFTKDDIETYEKGSKITIVFKDGRMVQIRPNAGGAESLLDYGMRSGYIKN